MAASASPPSAPKTYSLIQAAGIIGVHRNTLAKWIDHGCPVVQRADRDRGVEWEISIPDVIGWQIQRAVENAVSGYEDESGKVSKEEADRRRAVANAITFEIEADEALRSVVSRHEAEACLAAFCQVLKTGLSNASSKIAARATTMTNAPEIEELAQAEMNRGFEAARQELAMRWSERREPIDDDDGGEDQPA